MSEWTRWTTYNDNSLTKKVAGGLNLYDDGVMTRSPQVGFVSAPKFTRRIQQAQCQTATTPRSTKASSDHVESV